MNGTRPSIPSPEVPEGWKAVWNELYEEWFYVNLHTSQTTWDKPTTTAFAPSSKTNMTGEPPSPFISATPGKMPIAAGDQNQDAHNSDEFSISGSRASVARLQDDLKFEKEILSDYDFDGSSKQPVETSNVISAWSRKNSCHVLIKRYSKSDPAKVAAAQRELNVLHVLNGSDNAIPPLLDYFDPANTVFVVCEDRRDESLRQYIEGRGPLSEDLLKAIVTQLMSALSVIFMNGFAHLRICDETLFIDQRGQLTIKDFQYAVEYGTEKMDNLYAAVGHGVKGADGIWCAPEVYAAEKEGVDYNGRKAVIWSCGVAIYYMVTGQLEKLSNLDHPAFMGRRSRTESTFNDTIVGAKNAPSKSVHDAETIEIPVDNPKPRRLSLNPHRRRSSAATPSSPHSRKQSLSSNFPTPPTLIHYPGNRLEVPSYARDIISKMLVLNPLARAELIEVAAKVPKEFVAKTTRPLMELAWLDYKNHVGPYAGLGIGAEEWAGGNGSDDASSVYSGISALSQSFTGLLSGKSKRGEGGAKVNNQHRGSYGR